MFFLFLGVGGPPYVSPMMCVRGLYTLKEGPQLEILKELCSRQVWLFTIKKVSFQALWRGGQLISTTIRPIQNSAITT